MNRSAESARMVQRENCNGQQRDSKNNPGQNNLPPALSREKDRQT